MGSACNSTTSLSDDEVGVIPRATEHVFALISQKRALNPNTEFYLRVQFLELYGETLRDLLDPVGTAHGKAVTIRDGPNDTLQIVGATEETVKSPSDMLALLERGSLCRTTGSTDMNAHSSRSHAIFTVVLEQHLKPDAESADGDETEYRMAKFHFVDLAGSERAKRTGATGQRMKEGININMGLLALGNVISALGAEENTGGATKFVPYRDSKLTRMLQDSLGGNSRTLMIACVSPADINFEESLNALRYANRARNIKNRAVINRDPATSQIAALKAQVSELKRQLALGDASGCGSDIVPVSTGYANETYADYEKRCKTAEAEVSRLAEQLERERRTRSDLQDKFLLLEAEREAMLGSGGEEPSDLEDVEDEELQAGGDEDDADVEETPEAATESAPAKLSSDDAEENDESTDLLKRRFKKNQRVLRQLAASYDVTLKSKEDAMKQITEEKLKFEALKTHYESKMAEMNEEVRETQVQRDNLEAKLKELESEHSQTDASKQEAARLRNLVAEKDRRLKELSELTKQLNDAKKSALEWQKKESTVRAEIEHVKKEKVDLNRKMSESQKRFMEELKDRKLEIAGLQREKARLAADASQMTARTERDGRLLQLKSEQVVAMQRKLREAQRLTSHSKSLTEREKKQRVELERLAALQVKREEELMDLRRALAKKEEAIARRNLLLEEMDRLKRTRGDGVVVAAVGVTLRDLVPEDAAEEDLIELEQRLEGVDSEISFRDRQCREVLQDESKGDVTGEDLDLHLSSLEQATEVCRILMRMFVESKKQLRERRVETERLRDQVVQKNQVVQMERRRTETLLSNVVSPSKLQHGSGSSSPRSPPPPPLNPPPPSIRPSPMLCTPDRGFLRSPTSHLSNNTIMSVVRIHDLEAQLKSMQVGDNHDDDADHTVEDFVRLTNKDASSMVTSKATTAKRKNDQHVPVWDRLTSPSSFTGIHKHRVANLRRNTTGGSINAAAPPPPPPPPPPPSSAIGQVSFAHLANQHEEEECVDELVVLPPLSTSTDTERRLAMDDDDTVELNASVQSVDAIEAIFAEAATRGESPEKNKQTNVGWERVAAQTTESYNNKRAMDAEARQRGPSSTTHWTSNRRSSPPTTRAKASQQSGKENFSRLSSVHERLNDPRFFTGTQKHRLAIERARRKQGPGIADTVTVTGAAAAAAAAAHDSEHVE